MIVEFSGGPMDGERRDLPEQAGAYWMPKDSVFSGQRNVHHYRRRKRVSEGAVVFEYTGTGKP